jgi:hypothetical protein
MAHLLDHNRTPIRPAHGKRRVRHHQPRIYRNLKKRIESAATRFESVEKRFESAEKLSIMLARRVNALNRWLMVTTGSIDSDTQPPKLSRKRCVVRFLKRSLKTVRKKFAAKEMTLAKELLTELEEVLARQEERLGDPEKLLAEWEKPLARVEEFAVQQGYVRLH